MPDTTYIIDNGSITLPDSLPQELRDSLISVITQSSRHTTEHKGSDSFVPLLLVLGILAFVWCRSIFLGLQRGEHVQGNNAGTATNNSVPQHADKDYLVYHGNNLGLTRQDLLAILQKYYPFYNKLHPFQQQRFINRLQAFMQQKVFRIYANEGFKEMPVLLSAAAIQITFGLRDYLLPHYQYIEVHPEEYFAENSFRVLAGNVEGNTITFAWNQFLKGVMEPNDGVNVGLHEMAHALYYQHVVMNGSKEKYFCACFEGIMEEGSEVYELKNRQHILFTDYAFKNLQEFWAESVELFFERPVELQNGYPELFAAIQELLKQNPINGSDPVLVA